MGNLTLKNLWARKRRVIGASIAVIIGVAFLTSTMVLGDAMTKGLDALFTEGYSGTDVEVRSSESLANGENDVRGTLDESIVDDLVALPEVAGAQPVAEGIATVVGSDGGPIGGNGPPTIGLNWVDHDRNPYVIVDGRAPAGAGEVVIDSGVADVGDLAVGDTTEVRVGEAVDVTVVGIAELGSGNSLGGVTFTWFDTETAQALLLGDTGLITYADLQATPGVSDEALRTAVDRVLPDRAEALTEQQLIDEQMEQLDADFLGFFKAFLLVFAGIALLVAAFSINNTFAILVAQRTRESALLRAIGASRRQILTAVTSEAALIGVVASVVGLGVGLGVAYGLSALLDAAGFGIPTSGMGLSPTIATSGLIVGVGITAFASIVPAVRASRVAPLAALRDVAIDTSGASWWRAALGVVAAAVGVVGVVFADDIGDSPMAIAGLGSVVAFVGVVLLGPVVARLAASVIGAPIVAVKGQTGVLARRNAMRNPKRTSGTASALMIGTAVVALFASFATSIKQSMSDLIDESFGGDLVIYPEGFSGSSISPDLADDVAALDGVDAVAGLAFAAMTLDGRNDEPLATDFGQLAVVASLGDVEGDLAGAGDDAVVVGRSYADDHGLDLGDTVTAGFLDGSSEPLTVAAIYSNENLFGDNLVSAAAWERHSANPDDFIVMVELAAGTSIDEARPEVQSIVDSYGSPLLETSDEYLETQGAQIDQMLGLVYGLLGLAVIIALIGIANTLSLSLHERTRELGLLRAVGQSRRALRSTVRWESVIIAIFGTVGGMLLGTFMCWGLMRALTISEGFGTFAPSYASLAVILGVAVVAGVIAAARPARRAAKLDVLQAIASE